MNVDDTVKRMFGEMGISSITFSDDAGGADRTYRTPNPSDDPVAVPSHSGGKTLIKKGDRIQLWVRQGYEALRKESTGTVLSIVPDSYNVQEQFTLAFSKGDGSISSCLLRADHGNFNRVVEVIE
jgi:hypothetical protein